MPSRGASPGGAQAGGDGIDGKQQVREHGGRFLSFFLFPHQSPRKTTRFALFRPSPAKLSPLSPRPGVG